MPRAKMPVIFGREVYELRVLKTRHSSVQNSPNSAAKTTSFSKTQPSSLHTAMNNSLSEHDDSPPTLPPRNYRTRSNSGSDFKKPAPDVPKFVTEEPRSNLSHKRSPSSTGVAPSHPDTVTADSDSPKEDAYADQLRQQFKKISQSHSSLSAARYQSKPVLETKTNISVSRPVELPPKPQEARPLTQLPTTLVGDMGAKASTRPEPQPTVSSNQPVTPSNQPITPSNHASGSHDNQRLSSGYHSSSPQTVTSTSSLTSSLERPRSQPDDTPPPPLPTTSPPEIIPRRRPVVEDVIQPDVKETTPLKAPRDSLTLNEDARPSAYRPDVNRDVKTTSPADKGLKGVNPCIDPPPQETMFTQTPPTVTVPKIQTKKPSPPKNTSEVPRTKSHMVDNALINGHECGGSSNKMKTTLENGIKSESWDEMSVPEIRSGNLDCETKIETPRSTKVGETILRGSTENLCDSGRGSPGSAHSSREKLPTASPTNDKLNSSGSKGSSPSEKPVHEPYKKLKRAPGEKTKSKRSPKPPKTSVKPTEKLDNEPKSELAPTPEKYVISHVRQKSLEEIAYEKQAAIVAGQIRDKDRRLSEVILPSAELKKTTDFIVDVFDTKVPVHRRPSMFTLHKQSCPSDNNNTDPLKDNTSHLTNSDSSGYWSPPTINELTNQEQRNNSDLPLEEQKEELISRLQKKLEILKDEKQALAEETDDNTKLGIKVTQLVEEKCQSEQEVSKYKLYVDELEKVTILLLRVSGRLARAENDLLTLPQNASQTDRNRAARKRDELYEKHEDAKTLKAGIDRRRKQVSTFLQSYFTVEELNDYDNYTKMKTQLSIEQQEVEERMKIGEEQLRALQQSMTKCS